MTDGRKILLAEKTFLLNKEVSMMAQIRTQQIVFNKRSEPIEYFINIKMLTTNGDELDALIQFYRALLDSVLAEQH